MKDKKLYVGEILKVDGYEHKSANTLILAPVGSGKTFFIKGDLMKRHTGKKLLLVSTTSLKESLEEEKEVVTTKDLRRRGRKLGDEELHVMTYAELGTLIKFSPKFLDTYGLVVCDEVHSLFEYYMMDDRNVNYAFVIYFLFTPSAKRSVYYFTATLDKVDAFVKKENINILESVETVNYLEDERILRYLNIHEMDFSGLDELDSLIFNLKDLRKAGKKGVIFNEFITEMKDTEEILKKKGYRAISIWSVNNAKQPMTKEQLFVRAHLLKTGVIPDGYDFLIINGSMREGWNLIDEAVEVVILNTYDKTNIIQARGRVRKDIYLMVVRSRQKTTTLNSKILKRAEAYGRLESYLDRDLTSDETRKLAEDLNVRRGNNTLVGFTTLKKAFQEGGYNITAERKTVDGKRAVYTTITRSEKTRSSTEAKASSFLNKLEHVNFILENEKHLDSYLKKGRAVALNNIKSAYIYTTQDFGWKERKFTDATYFITRDKEIYSRKNYKSYGSKLERMEEIEILEERARYEAAAALELELAKEAKRAVEDQEYDELLAYIKSKGG